MIENQEIQREVVRYLVDGYMNNPNIIRRVMDEEDRLLTMPDFVELFGKSERTIKKWLADGDIVFPKIAGEYSATRKQFREQRDRLLAKKKRGF